MAAVPSAHVHNSLEVASISTLPQIGLINPIAFHTELVAFTIFFYDYLVTLPTEITCVWLKKPLSKSALCFFINRYIPLLGNIVVAMYNFSSLTAPEEKCRKYSLARQLLLAVNQGVVCLLLALRTYALYGCSRRIAWLIGCIVIAAVALSLWALVGQDNSKTPDFQGCHTAMSWAAGVNLATVWEAQAVFDLTIFALTVVKTLQTRRERMEDNIDGRNTGLADVIVRDGALYFAVMVVSNVANILTFYLAEPILKGFLSTLASCISVTLMSRLMLNLYKVYAPIDDADQSTVRDQMVFGFHASSTSTGARTGGSSLEPSAVSRSEGGVSTLPAEAVIPEEVIEMDDVLDIRKGTAGSSSSAV